MSDPHHNIDGVYRPASPQIHIYQGTPVIPVPKVKKRHRWLKITLLLVAFIVVAAGSAFLARSMNLSSKVFVGQNGNLISRIGDVIRGSTGHLKLIGEENGQINMLLLGIGGEGHDGSYLTDTIILVQLKPKDGQVSLVSIPRDYLADLPGIGGRKINAAFSEAFVRNHDWNEGGKAIRDAVGNMSGLDIPYFAVVDFSGFERAVDEIGGLDITIDRTFTDYKYPDNGVGYLAPQTFTEGVEHMNGKRALVFARSRHATGPEGTDFARSIRQQKIIEAFKSKVVGLNIIKDSNAINKLLSVFADHFHTNITPGELLHVYNIVKDYQGQQIASVTLDPESKIICPKILETNGAYVLVPCPGKTDDDVKAFFKDSFTTGKVVREESAVWIATSDPKGLVYVQTAKKLEAAGLKVLAVEYTEITPEESVIYQVNPKPATIEYIKNLLSAREVTLPPPHIKIDNTKTDVIVVLGKNLVAEPEPQVQSASDEEPATAPPPAPAPKVTPAKTPPPPAPTPKPQTSTSKPVSPRN